MTHKRIIHIIVSAAFLLSACSGGKPESDSREPVYNNAQFSSPKSSESTSTTVPVSQPASSSTSATEELSVSSETVSQESTDVSAPIEPPAVSATAVRQITRGNTFEENASFGHFCAVDNGYYFVGLNDGFLYFTDKSGNTKIVLEDYARALNYYDGYLYYIKGTKSEFLSKEYFYAGSIWRLEPVSGDEVCLIEVPENMSLNVNEYGIFCNRNGGGLTLYDFDGKELRCISDINQGVYIIGNMVHLRKSDKTVLCDLDTNEESDFPNDMFLFACIEDRVVCAYESDQWTKIILKLSTGETSILPQSAAFTFAACDGELYAADNDNLYRIDLEETKYESVISFPQGSPVYFYDLHSDGERLYAVMGNQSDTYRYAEVDIENGELKYLEEQ